MALLPRALVAAACLLAVVAGPAAGSGPTAGPTLGAPSSPTSGPAAGPAMPAAVVLRAAVSLHGSGSPKPGGDARDDATMALRDVFSARPQLHGDDHELASHLLARPTDGRADPYGDGYTTKSVMRCSRHICLHWVTSTRDKPPSQAWVHTVLRTMNQVWHHHIGVLGYRPPPSDGRRGGNAKYDVYLKELGDQGLYGYCAPERKVPGRPSSASSYCVLDNDFARREYHTDPIKALRVTAAHEFFHAIQFGYDYHEDRWIMEATATWMENRFAGKVGDNHRYLPYGQVGLPSIPLDTYQVSGYAEYGNWAFFEYLSERFGNGIVRQVWQHLGNGRAPEEYSVQGLRSVLAHHGGLPRVLAAFAGGNTVPGLTYDGGRSFPRTQVAGTHVLTATRPSWTSTVKVDHLAASDLVVRPARSLTGGGWALDLTVRGPAAVTSPAAYVVLRKGGHRVSRHYLPLVRSTDGGTAGHVVLPFGAAMTGATVSLVNASTRYTCHHGTMYACAGRPLDDHQPFTLTATLAHRTAHLRAHH